VLWRDVDGGLLVCLVHRPRYQDWSLPKGKLEQPAGAAGDRRGDRRGGKRRPGEPLAVAACREIAEETGWTCVLGRRLGHTEYQGPTGPKRVHYWAARARSDHGLAANDEVDRLQWLPIAQASELLTYPHDRELLARFPSRAPEERRLVLVRHAKAGDRERWADDDDLRPLSRGGRRQAEALRALLTVFGPAAVHSAPPVRCVQTLWPLADALGTTVAVEPLLGEDGYAENPDAATRRLRQLSRPGDVALCSQGGAIPALLATLLAEHGDAGDAGERRGGRPQVDVTGLGPIRRPEQLLPARKGSFWVLSFLDGRLVAADYHDDPYR
jgi:8-oxo-dGTP diphosphatase